MTESLAELGIFNVLMSDSEVLYAHCSTKLHWLTRCAPFGDASLIDADMEVNFADETSSDDVVTVVATQPLTANEAWQKMNKGELRIFQHGEVLRS